MIPDLSTYGSFQHDLGYDGQIVDMNNAEIENLINDQAVAIQFGYAVARSAANNSCKAPAADGDKIIGLAVRFPIRPSPGFGQTNANVVQFNQNDTLPVLRHGFMYKVAGENSVRGDGVISLTANNGKLGSTTGGAAGAGRVAVPNAVWETTTTAGQVGIVRITN
jgi:hypothetical protein